MSVICILIYILDFLTFIFKTHYDPYRINLITKYILWLSILYKTNIYDLIEKTSATDRHDDIQLRNGNYLFI